MGWLIQRVIKPYFLVVWVNHLVKLAPIGASSFGTSMMRGHLLSLHPFMKNTLTMSFLGLLATASSSFGVITATVWTDGAGDQMWSSTANWNTGLVPSSSTNVQIGTQPTGDQIGVDTGGEVVVSSFTFNNTLTSSVDIAPLTTEKLRVNGAITNNSAFVDSFSLSVTAGASAVWSGPLNFTTVVDVKSNTITLANAIAFSGLTFDIGAASYGKFAGVGSLVMNGNLNFNFTSATGAGTWDIANQTPTGTLTGVSLGGSYSAAFTEVTPGNWTANSGGLDWTYKASTGVLTAVPEPSTWALMAAGLTTMVAFRRRHV